MPNIQAEIEVTIHQIDALTLQQSRMFRRYITLQKRAKVVRDEADAITAQIHMLYETRDALVKERDAKPSTGSDGTS
jgi:hypothetical protein